LPRRLRFTDDALTDLAAAQSWPTQAGSGPAVRQRLAAIQADIRRLKQHPCLYPVVDHPDVRELPCAGGYHVLYEVDPNTGDSAAAGSVIVLRVYGPSQARDRFGTDRP